MWGILQECVYNHALPRLCILYRTLRRYINTVFIIIIIIIITDVEVLRQSVEEEWNRLDQKVIENAISVNGASKRLTACVQPAEDILNSYKIWFDDVF